MFLESPRFPESISYGALGGPQYKTDIVAFFSGFEQRNINWAQSRAKYDVAHALKDVQLTNLLIAFFRAMKGRGYSFRFKDWHDFNCSIDTGRIVRDVIDPAKYRLSKLYAAGIISELRYISKPVDGSVAMFKNGVAQAYTYDVTTGYVTISPAITATISVNIQFNITAISAANPGVITISGHTFVNGDVIKITSVVGMTQVNNFYFTITVVDLNNVSIGVNTSGYSAYISGGIAIRYGITQTNPIKIRIPSHAITNGTEFILSGIVGPTQLNSKVYTASNVSTNYIDLLGTAGSGNVVRTSGGTLNVFAQSGDLLTWSGEFDVPVRFDTDEMQIEAVGYDVNSWGSIPLVEVRV